MQITFRLASAADKARIDQITERAYAVWQPVLGYPPQPVTDDHAPRIERGEITLALQAGTVVGLIAVEPSAEYDLIFSVAVDPGMAGQGIGPQMIAEAEHRAAKAGKHSIKLYTNALMEKNIALYLRLGYRETGRRPNPYRPGFAIVDMEKPLAAAG